MGEYVTLTGGQGFKYATADDARYVRRCELEEVLPLVVADKERAEAASYLVDPRVLWRFPFPDEDGASWEKIGERSMSRSRAAFARRVPYTFGREVGPEEARVADAIMRQVKHKHMSFRAGSALTKEAIPGLGPNVSVACVAMLVSAAGERVIAQRKGFDEKSPVWFSTGADEGIPIEIYGERYDAEGRGRTIFCCGWCGAPFSLPARDLDAIRPLFPEAVGKRLLAQPEASHVG
jgi:hypothetical protein